MRKGSAFLSSLCTGLPSQSRLQAFRESGTNTIIVIVDIVVAGAVGFHDRRIVLIVAGRPQPAVLTMPHPNHNVPLKTMIPIFSVRS